MSDSVGCYLFAVARGLDTGRLSDANGLRGNPLQVVEHVGLQAVTCDVDLEEFGELGLRRHLEDLAWVEDVARCHNEVVLRVAELATTAPMRLVTIFTGDDGVRRLLTEHRDALHDTLDAIEGCQEWSVKAYAVPGAPAEQAAAVTVSGPGAGAAYLQRKRAAAQHRRASSDEAAAVADRLHAALSERSVASRRLPLQDPRLSGRAEPMLLNAAYLVPQEDSGTFHDAVRRLGESRGRHRRAGRPLAGVLVHDAGVAVSTGVVEQTTSGVLADAGQASLVDLLDRLLGTGVVLAGDVLISLSGVDLVQVRLHALITSVRADMPLPRHLRADLGPGEPW